MNSEKISFINGAGAEIRTRVPGSTVPEDDRLPYPGIKYKLKIVKSAGAGIRTLEDLCQQVLSLSPLASRAPPLVKNKGYKETIKNLNNY